MKTFAKIKLTAAIAGSILASSMVPMGAYAASAGVSSSADSSAHRMVYRKPPATSPGASLGSQVGFGLNWGTAFVGLGGLSSAPGGSAVTGAAATGIGFGDSTKTVGFEVDVALSSINTSDNGFGQDGNVGAKVHKMLPGLTSIAVGAEGFTAWGQAKSAPASVYAAVSKIIFLQPNNRNNLMPLVVSAGLGNGRFRTQNDQARNEKSVSGFGAIGLIFHPQISVIADYTGDILSAGMSFVPVRSWPVSLTVSGYDLAERLDTPKFSGSLAYIINF